MKKIFSLLLACFAVIAAQAQSFTSFEVVGALTQVSTRTNDLEVVVPNNFDLSNVDFAYQLESGSELDGPLPVDFSTLATQVIKLKKSDNSGSKTLNLTIKKINPSSLPFSKDFANSTGNKTADWTIETIGWAFAGIDITQAGNARYGTKAVSFIVAFNEAPKSVAYKINCLSAPLAATEDFIVEASANGTTWRTLREFVAGDLTTTLTLYTENLQSSDRYVRWVYLNRTTHNLNINNIVVTEADEVPGIGAPLNIAATGYGLNKFTVKNALQLYTKASSTTRAALELHAVVAQDFDFSKPANAVLETASGYTADPATLPTNFSTPQTVKFTKDADGTENIWTINVKPIKQATTLPLELSFNNENQSVWNSEVVGWATAGTNAARGATVAFDGPNVSFIIGFTQEAKTLSYDLFVNAAGVAFPAAAVFDILTADESASTWTPLYQYNNTFPLPASDAANLNHKLSLSSDVRYVKFVYTNRTESRNINLNNIIVSDEETTTWKGISTAWNLAANWSNGVPVASDDVIIPDGLVNYPLIPDGTTLNKIIFEHGAGADLAGTLTATVQVDYMVTASKWYAIGFPFAIATVYNHDYVELYGAEYATLTAYIPGEQQGDFWLRGYTGTAFAPVANGLIEANTGYIVQFPSWTDGHNISFISAPIILNNATLTWTAATATQQLVANPTLNTINLTPDYQSRNNYKPDMDNNRFLLLSDEAEHDLKAFESAIISSKSSVENLTEVGFSNEITEIRKPGETYDPIIDVRYYTLQGVSVGQPTNNGIYIVKYIRQSQKAEVSKIIIKK
jgi:hypothetical protein